MYPNLEKSNNNSGNNSDVDVHNEEEKSVEEPQTQGKIVLTGQMNQTTPSTMGHKLQNTTCCTIIQNAVKNIPVLNWYLAPITYDIGFSLSCLVYHWVNFFYALGMWIFLVTALCTFVPLLILACVGIPLLYLTFEITILSTRLNFYINYYLVETDEKLLTTEKWRVKLRMDNKNLPLCETCCVSGSRFKRFKFICTSGDLYLMLIYHLLVNPVGVFIFGLSSMPVLYLFYGISNLIRYPANVQWYKNNRECVGAATNCDTLPCNCHGWALNDFGDVFAYFLICLALLPFAFHLCNLFARFSKSINYVMLTDYYKYKGVSNDSNPNQSLMGNRSDNHKLEINNQDDVLISNTNSQELEEVPMTKKDINDHGLDEHNEYDNL